jgi:cytochrome c-type biogenesis protein CcmH
MRLGATARRLLWVAAILLAVGGRDDGRPPTDGERVESLARQFACPECAGQSVAASDAPAAQNIRSAVASLVDEGRTDAEIRALVVDRFGERVQLTPSATGVVSLVWVLPVVVGVVALGSLLAVLGRRRRSGAGAADPADRALVEAFLAERAEMSEEPGGGRR